MSIKELLVAARIAVDEADLPAEFRPLAFAKALDLLAPRTPISLPPEAERIPTPDSPKAKGEGSNLFEAIGEALGIGQLGAERLFDSHDGTLQFIGDLERLGKTKQLKVERLALLVLAARQAAGVDPDGRTPDSVIRTEVDRHGLYDNTNYTKHVRPLRQHANVNGSGRDATYKLKYEGKQAARSLAGSLLGDGS